MAKAEHAYTLGADSPHATTTTPIFTPASGELTYAGGRISLSPRLTRGLTVLVAAEGELVSNAELDRVFGACVERVGSRRQLLHGLREALAPLGIEIERVKGFGCRLSRPIDMRMPKPLERATEALRAVDEAISYKPQKPRQKAKPPEPPRPIVRVPTAKELEKRGPLHGLTRQQADDRYALMRRGQHVVAEVIAAADRAANEAARP